MVTQQQLFVFRQLTLRDFKIRYRSMSLGVLWSVVNPLIMVIVFTFVFTKVFPNPGIPSFPAFILCGLLPFNFFNLSWGAATSSIFYNAPIAKRVRMQRMLIPLSSIGANSIHFFIQLALLIALLPLLGVSPALTWLWAIPIICLILVCVVGLGLLTSSLDVYFRDVRYLVESFCLILFWVTPIFYSHKMVPDEYRWLYILNPLAANIIALRQALLDKVRPSSEILLSSVFGAAFLLVLGVLVFQRLKHRFAENL